jgi:hypothetical protein
MIDYINGELPQHRCWRYSQEIRKEHKKMLEIMKCVKDKRLSLRFLGQILGYIEQIHEEIEDEVPEDQQDDAIDCVIDILKKLRSGKCHSEH